MSTLFVRNGEVAAGLVLVLATDEVRDLLVLGLLNGVLIVLRTLTEELLLDEIDACVTRVSKLWYSYMLHQLLDKRTLVEAVLLLLALCSAASGVVELVADAAEETAVALLLGARGLLVLTSVVVVAAACEVLDEVHGC